MVRFIVTLLLFSLNISESYSQGKEQSNLAYQYYELGDSLLLISQYDSSMFYLKKASALFKTVENWEMHVMSLNKLSINLWWNSKLDESLELAEEALLLSKKHLGENHYTAGYCLENIASVHQLKGDADNAAFYMEQSIQILKSELSEGHEDVGRAYHSLCGIQYSKGKFQEAYTSCKKALKVCKNNFGTIHLRVAEIYLTLGLIYETMGTYDSALNHYEESLNTFLETIGEKHHRVSVAYDQLGGIYQLKGFYDSAIFFFEKSASVLNQTDTRYFARMAGHNKRLGDINFVNGSYEPALEYYKASLDIYSQSELNNVYELPKLNNSIGEIYFIKGDYANAMKYFERALSIRKTVNKEENSLIVKYIHNIGKVLTMTDSYDEAILYYNKAILLNENSFNEEHPDLMNLYMSLGQLYEKRGLVDTAFHYYDKSLAAGIQTLGKKSPMLTMVRISQGELFLAEKFYDKSLKCFQDVIALNATNFSDTSYHNNPSIDDLIDKNNALIALERKASTLQQFYFKDFNLDILKSSMQTFELCDTLINIIQQSHLRYSDKVEFVSLAQKVYQQAISTAELLFKHTGESKYLEKAFYYSEKSKSNVLAEKLSVEYAKRFSWLPDSLVQLEKNLKIEKAFYISLLNKLKTANGSYDTSRFIEYENQLFNINLQIDDLKQSFEGNHQKYYQLKYDISVPSITQIQEFLLPNQCLLEYFEDEESIHIFGISQNSFETKSVPKDSVFLEYLAKLRESFDHKKATSQADKTYNDFIASAHGLYETLLEPILGILPTRVNNLIIIPDGKLSYMPWEVFLKSKPSSEEVPSYRNLDYLFNQYSISYANSARLLFGDFYQSPERKHGTVLAFAPNYPDNIKEDTYEGMSTVFRDKLEPLEWNGTELNSISNYFGGNFLKDTLATEKAFKQQSGNYKILHLAMHALIDNDNPMLSKLVFTQDYDSLEDGMLHTFELFNMNLSAELAVLSACNTGIGKLQKGEGVMSLGRAFSYAGCPSIVMSHWSVDDRSTSELMSLFYKNLSEGKSKDLSLKQAKKEFLNNTDELRTHPLYWAGFVVLGDTKPLTNGSGHQLIYWLIGVVLVILVSSFTINKKLKSQKETSS